ncbi:MAG: helix-turn-helix domain-containing GNAT family N-acetyltransferase [Sphingobium sp.]
MTASQEDIATLRAFNRIYTLQLGLLNPHLDGSPFTLSEARVLYELAHRDNPTASEIARVLTLDRAQISRTLKRFVERGLVEARDNPFHGRQQFLSLTPEGRSVFDSLDTATRGSIGGLLEALTPSRRRTLIDAASAMMRVFSTDPTSVTLRDLRLGDLGLVVHRQAVLYADEYGYDGDYETLIAQILADFRDKFDPANDAAWIAEIDGRMAGSIFLVRGDEPGVCKLRLLYVEPDARGNGVGQRLIHVCVERARNLGYRRMELWTDSQLTAARSLYERGGFERIDATPARFFGQDIVSETWSLDL